MNAENSSQIQDLFHQALAKEPEERQRWLASLDSPTEIVAEVARLLRASDSAGSFLEFPPLGLQNPFQRAQKNIFVGGELVASRFIIERFLGRGGMGEVYAALDTESRERVALKVISTPAIEENEAHARLRRELLTARRVTHPNVCRVHDLARHDNMLCLTMELLDGETLAQALARGALPMDRAHFIAGQIAAGLAAAHAAGVLHRDLKPSNVMLCPSRIVLMDFGLAKWVDIAQSSLTASGTMLGTPDYMAPEQVSGGDITERTDIYSLGLIFYEMLTAEKPFTASTPMAAAMQRLQADAPLLPKSFPAPWQAVIARCLEREPSRRFSSVEQVRAALAGEISAGWRRPILTRRRATIFAATAGCVSLFAAAARVWDWRTSKSNGLLPGFSVMLADLDNLTGDPQMQGVSELFRNQLQQSPRFNVVEPRRVDAMLRQMSRTGTAQPPEVLREAAWRLQVPALVFGNLARVAGDYVLTLQLELRGSHPQAPQSKVLKSFSSTSKQALLRSVRDAGNWIRSTSGESAADIERQDLLPEDVTTPSWEAFHFYSLAERQARQRKTIDAIASLETALDRDPDFTLAAMRRGDHMMSLRRQSEGIAAWQQAIQLLGRRRVTRREELRVRGMFAYDSGDLLQSDKYFAQWAAEFPHDHRGYFYRTIPLLMHDRATDALDNLRQVERLSPTNASAQAQIANCAILIRDWPKARQAIHKLRELGETERPLFKEAILQFCQADFASAIQSLLKLSASKDPVWQIRAALYRGILHAELGQRKEAVRILETGVATNTLKDTEIEHAHLRIALAWLLIGDAPSGQIVELVRAALQLEGGYALLAHGGAILARSGAAEAFQPILRQVQSLGELPVFRLLRHRLQGEWLRQQGRAPEADAEFQQAAQLEPPLAYQEYRIHHKAQPGLDLLRNIASHPSILWLEPLTEVPGTWFRALQRIPSQSMDGTLSQYRQAIANMNIANGRHP